MSAFTAVAPRFTIKSIMFSSNKIKLPLALSCGSLIVILTFLLTTSPIVNIAYAIPFFLALFIFLTSILYLLVDIQGPGVSRAAKQRIIFISTFCTVFLMFTSSRSLSLADLFILLLIVGGLYFYAGRR